jgi:7-cyano-7-deazaguanine synthase
MKATVVPNRNLIMLAVAGGIAAATGAEAVATGVHAGDHPIYPDCRPEFIQAASVAIGLGTAGLGAHDVRVYAPFVDLTKTRIAQIGEELDVPWELTWSCYEGGELHCGRCGTCVERIEALTDAGVTDPTAYAP